MNNIQMELGFDGARKSNRLAVRRRRMSRAAWWFDRMRDLVDRALDREAAVPSPEQILFPGVHRSIVVAVTPAGGSRREELQISA